VNRSLLVKTWVLSSSTSHPDWLWGPPASYQMGTGGSFHGGKMTGALS